MNFQVGSLTNVLYCTTISSLNRIIQQCRRPAPEDFAQLEQEGVLSLTQKQRHITFACSMSIRYTKLKLSDPRNVLGVQNIAVVQIRIYSLFFCLKKVSSKYMVAIRGVFWLTFAQHFGKMKSFTEFLLLLLCNVLAPFLAPRRVVLILAVQCRK